MSGISDKRNLETSTRRLTTGFLSAWLVLCTSAAWALPPVVVPPGIPDGRVVEIVPAGEYLDNAALCRIRDRDGREHAVTLRQRWPVRSPRPVAERLPADQPMLTGQRILDCLLPVAAGSSACARHPR